MNVDLTTLARPADPPLDNSDYAVRFLPEFGSQLVISAPDLPAREAATFFSKYLFQWTGEHFIGAGRN